MAACRKPAYQGLCQGSRTTSSPSPRAQTSLLKDRHLGTCLNLVLEERELFPERGQARRRALLR